MKDYIDALTQAHNAHERQQITRDQMGMQDLNIESFVLGFIGTNLVVRGIAGLLDSLADEEDY